MCTNKIEQISKCCLIFFGNYTSSHFLVILASNIFQRPLYYYHAILIPYPRVSLCTYSQAVAVRKSNCLFLLHFSGTRYMLYDRQYFLRHFVLACCRLPWSMNAVQGGIVNFSILSVLASLSLTSLRWNRKWCDTRHAYTEVPYDSVTMVKRPGDLSLQRQFTWFFCKWSAMTLDMTCHVQSRCGPLAPQDGFLTEKTAFQSLITSAYVICALLSHTSQQPSSPHVQFHTRNAVHHPPAFSRDDA